MTKITRESALAGSIPTAALGARGSATTSADALTAAGGAQTLDTGWG
ncbi:hypothetical protein AAH978_12195 [Streptomyces sp. ZYX-F-203]